MCVSDVYLCRLRRCRKHNVTFPEHMTAVSAYLLRTTCACFWTGIGRSAPAHFRIMQMPCRLSTCLLVLDWSGLAEEACLARLIGGFDGDWSQRITPSSMTECLKVFQVRSDTGWTAACECTYVYELEVLIFSHESEKQEILTGQLCVSTNILLL